MRFIGMGPNLTNLLAAWRRGDPVAKELRDLFAPLVTALPDDTWGMAFELLAEAVDELQTNSVPADEVKDFIRNRIRYAPKEQRDEDWAIVAVPESTRRVRTKNNQHTPSVVELTDETVHTPRGKSCVVEKPAGTPCPVQERDELLTAAKTGFEKLVANLAATGYSDAEIAKELKTTTTRIKRVVTILRNRLGFTYPAAG